MKKTRLIGIVTICTLLTMLGTRALFASGPGGALLSPFSAEAGAAKTAALNEPIIIDHTCTDLSKIPDYWVEQAKELLRVSYGHTSHGSQPVTGMTVLESGPLNIDGLYDFNTNGAVQAGVLSLANYTPDGDLGNPDRYTWEARTRTYLNGSGSDRNVVVWSWCSQADTTAENIDIYLNLMHGLEQDYPGVAFVYMTGHLNGMGETDNLHLRNEQIRAFVRANNGVLFDFADIESYDPDGDYFLDLGADDHCNYSGGNWADEWCAENPGDPLCAACSCSHSRPLNCNLKGRAFWWMLARLAGWSGPGETAKAVSAITPTLEGDTVAYTVTVQNLPAPLTATVYVTDTVPTGLSYVGGSLDVVGGTGTYAANDPELSWSGVLSPTGAVTMTYRVQVTAVDPGEIVNTATIDASGYQTIEVTATILVNPLQTWLPLVLREMMP
jgi:uncharacterized repeat protein (TIGR01451 family)